ncbi:hypothetical protein, partial [Streptomyces sp. NPDC006551]|uniref:hypothetical protein n=1 Tax=Streptomyces sp. NPDC006551 TaxID=3157178 RepID=UPI0033B32191
HQPLPNRLELEALDSVMQGDTYSANGFILGIDAQQRRELANHLDIYRTLLDRALQAETAA